jgi:L-malate glycosyltransferase
LAVADLFIMPSESESFGLAALEAMACQLPVISSNSGGLPELNINGVTGFTSDVGNVEEMANNAIMLLTDEAMHQTFRANALARAEEFDIEKIIVQYEMYYAEVIQNSVWQKS